MFKAQMMSKLLIAASKDQLDSVVRELYRYNVFHVEDFVEKEEEEYQGFKIGKPMKGASETSTELLKIRSIINMIGLSSGDVEIGAVQKSGPLSAKVESELPAIEKEVSSLVDKKNSLETTLRENQQKVTELEPFVAVPLDLSLLRGYAEVNVFVGHIPADTELPVDCEKYFTSEVAGNLLIAVVSKSDSEKADRALSEAGFTSVVIPEEDGTAKESISRYTQEITRLESEIGKLDGQISAQKEKHASFLVACDELLTAEVEQAEVPLRFATTDEAFVAEGWVPSDKTAALIKDLESVTGGKIFVTETEVDYQKDTVPVEYDNPDFAKPTEVLVDIYSRPKYSEFDPTLLVAIVFPIFFGFILGDVGYGLVLLAASFGLRSMVKGSEAGNLLLDVLRNASVSSIVFGIFYSEFLGFALPWDPLWINRHFNIGAAHGGHGPDAILMLILSAWVGILHITLGRSLHIYNAKKTIHPGEHQKKVIFGQLGWIFVMWGILFILWSMFALPLMPDLSGFAPIVSGFNMFGILGAVLLIAGVVGIGQESALELMELPTVISHVLSYTRLAAVGLSSVAIAAVTNFISIGMMIEPAMADFSIMSIVLIIAGIVVFLLGHILNTALGLLGGGLHSIRLHYVEFFTKFYQGGGRKYEPFGIKRKFTED